MISPRTAKLVELLPDKLVTYVCRKIVDYLIKKNVRLEVKGIENLKNIKKPVIFICNHLSNSDALILDKILKDQDVTYVAGVKIGNNATTNMGTRLLKTTPLKPNSADKEGLSKIVRLVKSGNNIVIFPEGTRSRTSSMIEAKKGLLLIAKLTGAPIIPIGICGTEKFMPINEQGDMAAESFHPADIKVSIGKQIMLPEKEQGEDRVLYENRAMTVIMKSVAELIPEQYRGVYK